MRNTVLSLLLLTIGCNSKPKIPMLHVIAADPCDRPSIVGVIGNREYRLNVKNPPLYLACPGVLRMADVGKDFPATVDLQREEMTIEINGEKKVLQIDGLRETQ